MHIPKGRNFSANMQFHWKEVGVDLHLDPSRSNYHEDYHSFLAIQRVINQLLSREPAPLRQLNRHRDARLVQKKDG